MENCTLKSINSNSDFAKLIRERYEEFSLVLSSNKKLHEPYRISFAGIPTVPNGSELDNSRR